MVMEEKNAMEKERERQMEWGMGSAKEKRNVKPLDSPLVATVRQGPSLLPSSPYFLRALKDETITYPIQRRLQKRIDFAN